MKNVDNLQNCQYNIISTMQICCVYCFDRNNPIVQKIGKFLKKMYYPRDLQVPKIRNSSKIP